MNPQYISRVPQDLADELDAKAAAEGETWQSTFKFALWTGFAAIDAAGGLRKAALALGVVPFRPRFAARGAGRVWRNMKLPGEVRGLADMAKREGVSWQDAQRLALIAGFATIDARGGLEAMRCQVEAARRSVVTPAPAGAGDSAGRTGGSGGGAP